MMASSIVVRNIKPAVVQALKETAARHGRSAEAEHREILRVALTRPARRSFKEVLASMPDVGTDEDLKVRQGEWFCSTPISSANYIRKLKERS
jgi:plasmid stability protein